MAAEAAASRRVASERLAPRSVPLTVIGGFLGAGKTTLLNRMLADAAGQRLAVLVNDFGAINLDAALVASASVDAIALTNGCVCCTIGDDLSAALIRVLDARPAFDAVVIEASGVSDPGRIARLGHAAPELALDGVVVLVDAAAALEQAADARLTDTLERQLRAADLVVLNKVDLVDATRCAQLRDWIVDVAGEATPCVQTTGAALPAALLSGQRLAASVRAGASATVDRPAAACMTDHDAGAARTGRVEQAASDHGGRFATWAARPQATLSVEALREALSALPPGVLRLKGLLRTREHGWTELQFAGRHWELRQARAAPADGPALVAIGLAGCLPVDALREMLRA